MPESIPLVSLIALVALALLALTGAGWDLVQRRIPNWLNLLAFLSGAALLLLQPGWSEIWPHLAHFGIAIIAGMVLFALRVWGGGDAKFYGAIAIWFPLGQAPLLALLIALAGAALVLGFAILALFRPRPGWSRNLPYGVAIAAGALLAKFLGSAGASLPFPAG